MDGDQCEGELEPVELESPREETLHVAYRSSPSAPSLGSPTSAALGAPERARGATVVPPRSCGRGGHEPNLLRLHGLCPVAWGHPRNGPALLEQDAARPQNNSVAAGGSPAATGQGGT